MLVDKHKGFGNSHGIRVLRSLAFTGRRDCFSIFA
jgi:hypothetical protein